MNEERISYVNMNIFPLEVDLLSLEINDSYYQSVVREDLEFQSQSIDAINRLEKVFGIIRYKFAKGNNSAMILNKILKDHKQKGYIRGESEGLQQDQAVYMGYDIDNPDLRSGEIEGLIMLDR